MWLEYAWTLGGLAQSHGLALSCIYPILNIKSYNHHTNTTYLSISCTSYVGGAPGKVDLYVGKEVVKRAIPNELACDALVDLIKDNGRWVDKDVEVDA